MLGILRTTLISVIILNYVESATWLEEMNDGIENVPNSYNGDFDTYLHSMRDSWCNFHLHLDLDANDENHECINELTQTMESRSRKFYAGDFICSSNKQFFFGMTHDGYLSLCKLGEKVWKTGPFEGPDVYAAFQRDGNFVVYSTSDTEDDEFKVLFKTDTRNDNESVLKLYDQGSVEIKTVDGDILWMAESHHLDVILSLEKMPTQSPTLLPSLSSLPSDIPSNSPLPKIENIMEHTEIFTTIDTDYHTSNHILSYHPGKLYFDHDLEIFLSEGLTARLIAKSGSVVPYGEHKQPQSSEIPFHESPDAAACFPSTDGGWYYMSNSEVGDRQDADGGVGKITFDPSGDVIDYKMVLTETRMNCGSGKTPWGTFISCEEIKSKEGKNNGGRCYEVHPEDKWPARATKIGGITGNKFESAAFDSRDMTNLKAFVTVDREGGPLYRFSPDPIVLREAMWSGDFSQVLHVDGFTEFLVLHEDSHTFEWSTDISLGEDSARKHFPNAEGIDVHDGVLYFVSKLNKELITLDLDYFTYTKSSTKGGVFDGQPDQIVRLLPSGSQKHSELNGDDLLYFLEEGGDGGAGVFAQDRTAGKFFSVVEGGDDKPKETTGLAFCDEGRRMMFAFQKTGEVYEVKREDNLPFFGGTVDVKYHEIVVEIETEVPGS